MLNKNNQAEARTEHLIYGPWSWILSSSTNLLMFAVLVCLVWMLYKRSKAKGKHQSIAHRRVEVNKKLLDLKDLTKINALVTGGSGTLGKEIVKHLLMNGGYKVHSLDLFIPEKENRNSEICSYIQTDITNLEDICIATKGMDVVFHTAAIVPMVISAKDSDFDDINLKGTENVIAACKECKVKRLIYTSTVDVVLDKGQEGADNLDEDCPTPEESLNAYVRTKRGAEEAVLAANSNGGLTTCALRPGGILEPMLKEKVDRPFCIGENGLVYGLVTCKDLAKVHVHVDNVLINKSDVAAGKTFNIAVTVYERELAETIATELDDGQRVLYIPMSLIIFLTYFNVIFYKLTGIAPVSPRMTVMVLDFVKLKSNTFSSSRAERELGWKPTSWKDDVKNYIKEWKETKKEK